MTVTVNNRALELTPSATVSVLLTKLGIEGPYALVERNGEPVSREEYDRVQLEEGDQIVVARPVAGG